MKFRSFQAKLMIAFLGLFLMVQTVVFLIINEGGQGIIEDQLKEELIVGGNSFQNFIDIRKQELVNSSILLSGDFAFKAAFGSNDLNTIYSAMRNHKERIKADLMMLVSLEGQVIAHSELPELRDKPFPYEHLLEIAEDEGAASEILLREDNSPYQMVMVPLKAPVEVAWIVLGFEISTSLTQKFSALTNTHVLFAGHKDQKWYRFASSLPFEVEADQLNLMPKVPRPNDNNTFSLQIKGEKFLGLSKMLSGDDSMSIYVVLMKSFSSGERFISGIKSALTITFTISMSLLILVSYLLARSISRPIVSLTDSANAIAEGNLDVDIEFSGEDEIGSLGRVFRKMKDNLKVQIVKKEEALGKLQNSFSETSYLNTILDRKLFETSLLLNISNEISRSRDTGELLDHILEQILISFQVDRGSIMLLDEKTQTLKLITVKKLIRNKQKIVTIEPESNVELKKGVGIAGKVVEYGEPRIIHKAMDDADFLKYNNWRDDTLDSLVCIPLKRGDVAFGVINLANESTEAMIKDDDIEFLSSIATHVSMILQNRELLEASITDEMTGLYNKRYFMSRFRSELMTAKQRSYALGVLIFDIDHFKKFNDNYGHLLGDEVIKAVARTASGIGRKSDVRCRYGGEEFIVILPDVTKESATKVAEDLREAVENCTVKNNGEELKVTISVGVALYPDHGSQPESLIKFADEALYKAKETGRNNVKIYSKEVSSPLKFAKSSA